jgi:dCTP deaminase
MKACPKCGDPQAEFYKDRQRSDGLGFYCKKCSKKRNAVAHQKHKKTRALASKSYVAKNRSKINASHTTWRRNLRLKVLHHYSNGTMACACCGEPNPEFLCIDHVHGGGGTHRRQIGLGGYAIYIWLRKNEYPAGFRVLCFNCNYAVIGGKDCPHTYRVSARGGGILSDSAILKNIERGVIQISPFVAAHVNPASVDLTLGRNVVEYIIEGELDARVAPKTKRYRITDAGIALLPGRAYLMHTEETLRSDSYVTVLDGKSSLGRLFISVHETAGYIDVGFEGQVTLEVTVTHPVRVYAGMRFCQVRYHSVVGKPTPYGERGHYVGIRALGAIPSLACEQIKESGV